MADNYGVLDGSGNALTKAGKDIGSGVQADKAYLLDTALAEPFGSKTDAAWGGSGTLAGLYSLFKGIYVALVAPTPAGTNVIGGILGRASKSVAAPVVTAAAYAAGNVVGGLLTFTNVFDGALSGYLQDIVVRTASAQTTGYKLYLFSDNPTATTFTDKTALPALAAADRAKLLGVFSLGAADNSLTTTLNQSDGLATRIYGVSSSVYGVLVVLGTPTYASTSDISVELRADKD